VANIFLSLIRSKVNAVFLEPKGFGYMGLLQAMVSLLVLVAGLGVGSGLVKMGASRVAANDRVGIASFWQAARLLVGLAIVVVVVLLVIFRRTLSLWFLGAPEYASAAALMGIATAFTLAGGLQTNILNTYHRVEALAKNAAIVSLLITLCSIFLIVVWRSKGIVPSVVVGSVITWLVGRYQLRKEVGGIPARVKRPEVLRATGSLLRFGVPYTASNMVGTAVGMALPILVLHMLGTESVGFYRAATSISLTYLGLLITSMSQDYYPRVSAVSDQPQALNELVNKQQRLVLLLGVPMILGTLALVPFLVPLAYSLKFTPTVEILEWQLIGDLFKFSSWTMAYAILARCSSSTYFFVELVGGATSVVSTWLAVRWFGLPGLGISFLVSYLLYYVVVWMIIRRETGLTLTAMNKWLLVASIAAAGLIRILSYPSLRAYRTPTALLLAVAAGSWSLVTISQEIGEIERIAPLQRGVTRFLAFVKTLLPET
jgi:PST family polysaccharide transporter